MLYRIINGQGVNSKYNPSFSLIEILISLALGSMLLLTFAKWFSDHYYNQYKQQVLIELQQHTHQLLTYLQQHIQHIGYQGKNRKGSNYDLFLFQGKSMQLASPHCLTFFYDLNGDGCIGSRNKDHSCQLNGLHHIKGAGKEIFGFKFEKKNLLILNENPKGCYRSQCQKWVAACQNGRWETFLDNHHYQIEKVYFEWVKPDELLRIELKLSSIRQPKISYQASAYSYLFNTGE